MCFLNVTLRRTKKKATLYFASSSSYSFSGLRYETDDNFRENYILQLAFNTWAFQRSL